MENPQGMCLCSDFIDYYDHRFIGSWRIGNFPTFCRFTRSGMWRPEMMLFLGRLGLSCPAFGRVRELAALFERRGSSESAVVIVHHDVAAHAGEGKERLPFDLALSMCPDTFATEYIQAEPAVSLRYLQVGRRSFWLRYESANDWRSNCGEVGIDLLPQRDFAVPAFQGISQPLFAVDFIEAGNELLAIDFNIAPRIQGTGVENILPPAEVYEEIVAAHYRARPALNFW